MPLRQKWCGILRKPVVDVPAAEEMTVVLGAMVIVRKIAVPAMMAAVVALGARGRIVVAEMNVVARAALPVVDNAQVRVVDVPKDPGVLATALQAVAAVALPAGSVAQMIVAPVPTVEIAGPVQKERIAAQDRKAEIVALAGKGIVVRVDVINTGWTGISMSVLAFQKAGLSASCPNLVPWKHSRNKSRHPAGPIPFLMSRNCSFPAGIVICCTSIIKSQPVARISQRRRPRRRKLQHPSCCNARSTDRSG